MIHLDMGIQALGDIFESAINSVTSALLVCLLLAAFGVAVLVLLGPSVWLLRPLRHNSETMSAGRLVGVVGRLIGAVTWPFFVLVSLWAWLIIGIESDRTDVDNYDSARASYDYVDHFPDDISNEQVHDFYGETHIRSLGSECHHIPPGNSLLLTLDISPEKAEVVYQQANSSAAYVVTWAGSAPAQTSSSEPIVLEHRSGLSPSGVPLQLPSFVQSTINPADYVAYFFETGPHQPTEEIQDDTTTADSSTATTVRREQVSSGVAFHKTRSRVLYWTEWTTC